jgi:hypothetical protein
VVDLLEDWVESESKDTKGTKDAKGTKEPL